MRRQPTTGKGQVHRLDPSQRCQRHARQEINPANDAVPALFGDAAHQ